MKKIFSLLLVLTFALSALASNAYAGNLNIVKSNNMVGVGYLYTAQHYAEHISNMPSDSETGHASGIKLFISAMRNIGPVSNVYGYVNYYRSAGASSYSYPGTSGATSGLVLSGYSLRAGKGFNITDNVIVTPYLNYGYREWSRVIGEGIPGSYQELYQYSDYGIGVIGEYTPINKLVLKGRVQVDTMIGNKLNVYSLPGGFDGDIPLTLGKKPVYTFSVGADYSVGYHVSVFGNLSLLKTSFGQSSPNDGIYEPNSDTTDLGLNIGVGYNF